MNDKIRYDGLHMEGRRRGNGAAAHVKLDADIIYIGHIADFLYFRDAAGIAQVRLGDAECPVLKELPESPARIAPLTGCKGDIAFLLDMLKYLRIGRHGRFLIVHDAVRLQGFS